MAQTLPYEPTRATNKNTETRTLRADLGDGYSQRAGDGINIIKQRWSMTWALNDTTVANALVSFFSNKGGYIYFLWTPFRETSPRKFICPTWGETFPGDSNTGITAEFEEVFDQPT